MSEHDGMLLGAVLGGYSDLPALSRTVTADDFEQHRHGAIWQACLSVHKSGEAVNPTTVGDALGNDVRKLPDGRLYLLTLTENVLPVHAPYLAVKVREQSMRRRMRDIGSRMVAAAESDLDRTPAEWASEVRRWTDEVGHTSRRNPTMAESLERVIDAAEKGQTGAVPTPWPSMNDLIIGLFPGQLVTFAARPGAGKSIALQNMAVDIARRGLHVALCTLEMFADEVVQRMVAHVGGVELTRLRKAQCSESDWERIRTASEHLQSLPLYIQDSRPQTVDDIRAHAWETQQAARRQGQELGAVVVDYVQIVRSLSSNKGMSRQQQVGQITQDLKNLAGELNVPVVTAAQLNRQAVGSVDSKPELWHLREAGDIENDSDVVALAWEEVVEEDRGVIKTGVVKVDVAKNRSGPQGQFQLSKRGHYARLSED